MLTPELTPRSARRQRRRSARATFLTLDHEGLFLLLTTLRAASAEALHTLHFAMHPTGGSSLRATYRWISALEEAELLERQVIHGMRTVYRLTRRSLMSSPRISQRATENFTRPMSPAIAGYAWIRAAMWAEMAKRGYRVGRGRDELRAVRRFLVDGQRRRVAELEGPERRDAERVLESLRSSPTITPLFRTHCRACGTQGPLCRALDTCSHCGKRPTQVASELRFACPDCGRISDAPEPKHLDARDAHRTCTAPLRETDHLPFDVAWRDGAAGVDVVLLVIDDPTRSLVDQLNDLPLRVSGQPVVPVVLRTTDEESVFDPTAGAWVATGARHRELLRAFSDEGDRHLFPFRTTTRIIDARPELQLRLRASPRQRDRGE